MCIIGSSYYFSHLQVIDQDDFLEIKKNNIHHLPIRPSSLSAHFHHLAQLPVWLICVVSDLCFVDSQELTKKYCGLWLNFRQIIRCIFSSKSTFVPPILHTDYLSAIFRVGYCVLVLLRWYFHSEVFHNETMNFFNHIRRGDLNWTSRERFIFSAYSAMYKIVHPKINSLQPWYSSALISAAV